jgi:hypothetical protein
LNPRPECFNEEDYILSLPLFLLLRYQETGLQETAFIDDPMIPKAKINGLQPYMTPGPELGWPPRQT